MLAIGELLQNGRYEIIDYLGEGGMAIVYLATDGRLGHRKVAIKQMDASKLSSTSQDWAIAAFRQEAEVLARLQHRAIAKVTDFFEEQGYWYLVMEYVSGETLEKVARRTDRFSTEQALEWAGQLAAVLDYLHNLDSPLIYRDLKPSNVMLQPNGELKLIDFGIARFFKPGQSLDTVNLGTPGFSAPEQYGQSQSDPRSDVYSLAVLLHHLLTGFNPAVSPLNLPPVQQLRPELAFKISTAISQALELDPARRFLSVMAFATALGAPIPGPVTPRGDSGLEDGSRGIWGWVRAHSLALLGGLLVLVIATAAAVLLIQSPENGPPTTEAEEQAGREESTPADEDKSEVESGATKAFGGLSDDKRTATAEAIIILSYTPTPTLTPTSLPTNTPTPSRTPRPTPTQRPTFTPTPTTPATGNCTILVYVSFQNIYREEFDHLGCTVNYGH